MEVPPSLLPAKFGLERFCHVPREVPSDCIPGYALVHVGKQLQK